MAKENKIVTFKKKISNGEFSKVYLFYGEEEYIRNNCINRIFELIPDNGFADYNHIRLDGKESSIDDLAEVFDSFPMMSDRRVVLIKDSGAFATIKRDDEREYGVGAKRDLFSSWMDRLGDDTILIFDEVNVDKRMALYKAIDKKGEVLECPRQTPEDRTTWLIRVAREMGCKIDKTDARYFVDIAEPNLETLKHELEKCTSYCNGEITRIDIDRLVSKSSETVAFDLYKMMIAKRFDDTMRIIEGQKTVKNSSPLGLLSLLYSSFNKLLKARLLLDAGESREVIRAELKIPPFVVNEYISNAKAIPLKKLEDMVRTVAIAENDYIGGTKTDWQALEDYVFSFFE